MDLYSTTYLYFSCFYSLEITEMKSDMMTVFAKICYMNLLDMIYRC